MGRYRRLVEVTLFAGLSLLVESDVLTHPELTWNSVCFEVRGVPMMDEVPVESPCTDCGRGLLVRRATTYGLLRSTMVKS